MLLHYIKIAFRNLWKYKVQNLIGIAGLAIGLAVFSITAYFVRFMWETDTQYPGADRMYEWRTDNYSNIPGNYEETMAQFPEIEVVAYRGWPNGKNVYINLNGEDCVYSLVLAEVSTSFPDFFSYSLAAGNKDLITTTPNGIVLLESEAKKLGDPQTLIGKKAIIDEEAFTITGIAKDLKGNSNVAASFNGFIFNKMNSSLVGGDKWNPAKGKYWLMIKANTSPDNFKEKIGKHDFKLTNDSVYIKPIGEKDKRTLISFAIIFAVALLVLLIALFNYISFQSAQFFNRLKECAIRKVNGAGSLQQLLLFYTEVAVVFILASFFGIWFIQALIPFSETTAYDMLLNPELLKASQRELIKYTFVGLALSFVFCILPAQTINRLSTRRFLLGLGDKGRKNRSRTIFLFIQMMILLIFASATLIISMQESKIKSKMWSTLSGQEKKEIVRFSYEQEELPNLFDPIVAKLKANTQIEAVTYANYPLASYGSLYTFQQEGFGDVSVREYKVADNFCDFFHVKLLVGSFLSERSADNEIVIDETTLQRYFSDREPLGALFDGKTIIGVVQNIQMIKESTTDHVQMLRPVFYSKANTKASWFDVYVKARPGKAKEVKAYVNDVLREYIPETLSVSISDFREDIDSHNFDVEIVLSLFASIFFVFALVLCLLSIFSAVMMSVEKRRKEVAIRKVNGATVRTIIRLFAQSYFIIWTLACLLVFPAVYIIGSNWVNTFTNPMSLGVPFFLAIYLVGLLFILLTVLSQIYKTVRENPAEVLKS